MDACVERFGRLDGVYNVAGISGRRFGDGPLHEMTLDGWQTVLANNVTSQFLVCRAAFGRCSTQEPAANGQRGVILNMSSVIARHPSSEFFATHGYAASKGAIESFSRSLAAYYAPHGIRVNVDRARPGRDADERAGTVGRTDHGLRRAQTALVGGALRLTI